MAVKTIEKTRHGDRIERLCCLVMAFILSCGLGCSARAREGKGKPNLRIFSLLKKEAMDLKGSQVMAVRLETGRSSPG